MRRLFVLIGIVLSLFGTNAYAQFSSENDLVTKIKACSDDVSLNMFLMRYDLIPMDSVNRFHKSEIKIDVFKKNLFGSAESEIVIQLRQPYNYAVSVYYYEGRVFKKVPGNLHCYFNGAGYVDQTFTFSFEPVFKANEYTIITKTLYSPGINRIINEFNQIYKVTTAQLDPVYEYNASYNYSPDPLTNDYSSTTEANLILIKNTYPKILVLNTRFESLQGTGISDDEPEATGYTTSGWIKDTVYFFEDGTNREVTVKHTG